MINFIKSWSRSVHQEQDQDQDQPKDIEETEGLCLTVWRKSLVVSCSGFTVFNSHGNLVYRVDNYINRPQELVLMDASGKSLLTMHQTKKLGFLVEKWHVYEGEVGDHHCSTTKKPNWYIRKQRKLILKGNQRKVLALVYKAGSSNDDDNSYKRHCNYAYVIVGSYTNRSCKVMDERRRVMAEVKRKESMVTGVCYGLDVFVLVVQPGIDPGFVMALVLLLDQMFS